MKPVAIPPSISEGPTINNGAPPNPALQARVTSNQVHSQLAWNDTAQDIVVNNIINENQGRRDSRRELVVLLCLALVLLIAGSIYTYRNLNQDRFVASERAAAISTPYRPETVR